MTKPIDLRLAAPVAVAWVVLAVAVAWPRWMALAFGLVSAAGGLGLIWRAGLSPRRLGLAPSRSRTGWPGRPALAQTVALTLVVTGVLAAAAGAQGLAWERSAVGRAAAAGQRADLVLRLSEPPKSRPSAWGGQPSVLARGSLWLASPSGAARPAGADESDAAATAAGSRAPAPVLEAMGGRGVPALVRLSGEAPASGEILVFRARLSPTEPAAAERIMADAVEDLSAFTPPGWRGLVHRLRKGLAQRAEPLLAGIAVGDTSGVSPGLDAALKTTSLTHITAVSGAHVAIVLGLALGLAALSGAPPWGSALAGGLTLAAFTALIGPSPSVLRAVLMGAATVAGLAAGKNRLALGALAAAVAVVLAANPWMARSFGLILSALSTAALIVAAPPLARWLRRAAPGLPRPVAEAAALTASAQLVCAPVIAVFAGQISLAALPANLAAAPAVPVATVFGLAALALAPLWPNGADGAAAVGNWAARWIAWIANSLDAQPAAAIAWPSGAGGLVTASAATLALAALAWWVRRAPPKARRTTLMAALAAGLAGALVAGPLRGPLRQALGRGPPTDWLVAACDVGQGTAVAVRSGPAAAVLIDAGPADGGVGRCLDDLAVTRLDAVILTHFHADHVGGLAEAVAGREWSSLVHGAPCGETAAAMRVSHIASRSGVERLEIGPDGPVATGQVGGLPVRVHPSPLTAACPSGPSDGEESAVNNAGLTVRLETAGVAVWALGDLEREGQDALLAQAGQSRPDGIAHRQATVVIVAHHGSANQSEALAGALAADVAVISVGQDNRYGHPTPQTIALYSRHGQIRRTDQDGLVALRRADLPGGG